MNQDRQPVGASGGDLRTLLLVLFALVLSEAVLRSTEDMLSGNIAHVNEISDLVADYSPETEPSFVFLGNSLTNNGVDVPLVNELLLQNGVQVGDSTKLVPDATTIWSWSCVLENQFFDNGVGPGPVVLGFGWDQLSDQSRILPTRLGAYFCSTVDLLTINKHRNLSSAEAGEFLTAKSLRTYAHRETVRNLILTIVVPHYQNMTQSINRQQRNSQDNSESQYSYSVLEQLINSLEAFDSRLVVVAMPVRDQPYEIESNLRTLLDSRGIPLFDYRHLERISYNSYLDDMHLNSDGATVLSTRLAKDLSTALASTNDRPSNQ